MSVTGSIMAIVGATAIGGAAIQANAAGNAASTQANAAMDAAQLQYLSGQNALDFQKQVWNQQQQNVQPWLQTGGQAVSTLDQLMGLNPPGTGGGTSTVPGIPGVPGLPGGGTSAGTRPPLQGISGASPYSRGIGMLTDGSGLAGRPGQWGGNPPVAGPISLTGRPQGEGTAMRPGGPAGGVPSPGQPGAVQPGVANGNLVPFAPWNQQFVPPTADQARQTPGYQFTENQGMQAVQNSAAARGDLLSGNTLTGLEQYGQGLADTTYQQTYDRALGQYQQNYNIYENNQANQWNRLAALAGYGQTAVGQLNSAGSNASGNVSNILLGTGANVGRDIMAAGGATASGYANTGNAYAGALGSIGSLGTLLPYLSMLNNNGAFTPNSVGTWPAGMSTGG